MVKENGWYVVQDTAWEGYTEPPLWIMQGYMTMCAEAVDQLRAEGLEQGACQNTKWRRNTP